MRWGNPPSATLTDDTGAFPLLTPHCTRRDMLAQPCMSIATMLLCLIFQHRTGDTDPPPVSQLVLRREPLRHNPQQRSTVEMLRDRRANCRYGIVTGKVGYNREGNDRRLSMVFLCPCIGSR